MGPTISRGLRHTIIIARDLSVRVDISPQPKHKNLVYATITMAILHGISNSNITRIKSVALIIRNKLHCYMIWKLKVITGIAIYCVI